MGHKVNPTGFRLGVVKGWQSRWYAEHDYKDVFAEDVMIRQSINKELANASISKIEIERAAANQVVVIIHTAKPGIVIGKSGEKVDKLRAMLEAKTKKRVRLNILEIRQPELDAYLVGRSIAEQLEKRVSFRRAMKQAVQKSMRANAKGVKVIVGGRLGGAEIARSEKEVEGKIPLHTLRADIDYGLAEAHTTFGVIGIKVWIYKGDILPRKRREPGEPLPELPTQAPFPPRDREGGERRGGDRRREGGERRGAEGGDRSSRPPGERSQGGDRGSRVERPPRPQGERAPRTYGERSPRPQQGERPQGQGQPTGERPPRQPRPPRPQGERAPRQQQPRAEQTSPVQSEAELPVPQPETELPVPTPEAQLPAPTPEAQLPAPAVEAQLPEPTPEAQLPAPAPEAQLPAAQVEAELPPPTTDSDATQSE